MPAASAFRQHIVFDDALHPLWTLERSASAIADAHFNESVRAVAYTHLTLPTKA